MKNFELIYNLEIGEQIIREYSEEENIKAEQERIQIDAANVERKEAEAAKAAARAALLAKLGITEEEARLLLGGN